MRQNPSRSTPVSRNERFDSLFPCFANAFRESKIISVYVMLFAKFIDTVGVMEIIQRLFYALLNTFGMNTSLPQLHLFIRKQNFSNHSFDEHGAESSVFDALCGLYYSYVALWINRNCICTDGIADLADFHKKLPDDGASRPMVLASRIVFPLHVFAAVCIVHVLIASIQMIKYIPCAKFMSVCG